MEMKICFLPGDGIGPEILSQARKVLLAIENRSGHQFISQEALIGGAAIDATGRPLPQESIDKCKGSDAVLLGAVGGPKWDDLDPDYRPEKGLLAIRKELGLFANLRPAIIYEELKQASYLKDEIIGQGINVLVVRELTGGIYFGEPKGIEKHGSTRVAFNTMIYKEDEIRRIAELAFSLARKRRKKLCSVDKANVLEVSRLWREVVTEVAQDFPDVELDHMYVDNAAMQLVRDPGQFDVLVTSNLFGDILSDEAATITGSIGMLPSASLGKEKPGLFEPIHGSAPDIAGQDVANPLATILSLAMMFRYNFDLKLEAELIEQAVKKVLSLGYRTRDLGGQGDQIIGCQAMGDKVAALIQEI